MSIRLSGPILDRMDIQKYVQPVNFLDLTGHSGGTSPAALVKEHCSLEAEGQRLLEQAYARFHYSVRAYHKFLKVARTFADLDGSPRLRRQDVAASLMARDMDREQAGMLIV